MRHHYCDIRSLIANKPKWWDENGVPRYCDFGPNEGADIYASEIVLLRIRCQNCARPFDVCMSWSSMDLVRFKTPSLAKRIVDKTIHYGDPPNIECCAAGPTMNSEPDRVLQYWRRERFDAVRDAALEIDVFDTP